MKHKHIEFTKHVEGLICPSDIATTTINAKKLAKLPKWLQNIIISKHTKRDVFMGFVVEPYSVFFSYEITEEMVKEQLPDNYELVPISLFENTKPFKCAVLGCFTAKTSVFSGIRYELYIIARNKKTGLVSWIICDYESNTHNYDPDNGFKNETISKAVLTTTFKKEIICYVHNEGSNNIIDFCVDFKEYIEDNLNQTLWIEGNLSVDYAGKLGNKKGDPFGLIFHPSEMEKAFRIKNESLCINKLNFGFINDSMQIKEICFFPHAQHYLTTVFPSSHKMRNKKSLHREIDQIIS